MAIDRREFLGALALAPAALAACSGASAARGAPAAGGGRGPADGGAAAATGGEAVLAAVRSFPLAADTEPAFVFRAAASRPGGR